jgi:hypothetical protein
MPGSRLDWTVFEAEVSSDVEVVLQDSEHDQFAWVSLTEALRRCLPATVAEAIQRGAEHFTASAAFQ